MTASAFRTRLAALGITLGRFADLTGVSVSTARFWGRERSERGVQAFPLWVGRLLDAWERIGSAPE